MQYKAMQGKLGELHVTYKQFSKINAAYQRSRFWRKEYGVILNRDGSAKFAPKADRYKLRVDMRLNIKNGDYATAHTHWEKEGVEWVDVGGNNTEFQKIPSGDKLSNKIRKIFYRRRLSLSGRFKNSRSLFGRGKNHLYLFIGRRRI